MNTTSRIITLVILAAVVSVAAQTQEAPRTEVARMLRDASRALQASNAPDFLGHFDRDGFLDYPRLETHVVALTRQAEIASSIEIVGIEGEGEAAYRVHVDWVLQISPLSAPGRVETRRETITLRAVRIKDKWKVADLAPVDFFRPREVEP